MPHIVRPCRNCPFKKDAIKGWLGQERMEEILGCDSFVCHKKPDKQCAGHMLINGEKNGYVRLAGRLGIELDLSGRELVFDTKKDCLDHHKR